MVLQHPELQRLSLRGLARNLRQLGRITTELQRTAMSLRLVPIRPTFQKNEPPRSGPGGAAQAGAVGAGGEDTELDRTIVEELGDPLISMVRNSADHGIEPPADRLAAGKPPVMTIRLSAGHERGVSSSGLRMMEKDWTGSHPG